MGRMWGEANPQVERWAKSAPAVPSPWCHTHRTKQQTQRARGPGGPGKHGTEPQETGHSPPQPSPGTACAADSDRLPPVPALLCMNRHQSLKFLLL